MKTIAYGVILLASGYAATCLADEPVLQWQRRVVLPDIQKQELLAITLDAEVFAVTEEDLSDLRLLDQQHAATPFLLRKVPATITRKVRASWPAGDPDVRPLAEGGLEIVVQLDQRDPQPSGVRLVTPLRNFEQRVRVETSGDGEQWQPANRDATIFDYSRYMDVRKDSVEFPPTAERYFRIVIDDVTAEQESALLGLTRRLSGDQETQRIERTTINRRPFRIERIEFWRETKQRQATGDKKTQYGVAAFRVQQHPDEQQTRIYVETRRQPLTSLTLEVEDRNFSRHATVEVEQITGVQRNWQPVASQTISRIDFQDFKREELSISFPSQRQEQYRLVIENRDSPPLKVSDVRAEGNVYEIVFFGQPEQEYRLAFGATQADRPQYDTASIGQLLREGYRPRTVDLLDVEPGPGAGRAVRFRWADLLSDLRILVPVIGLLVVLLGWGLYQAARRVDDIASQ